MVKASWNGATIAESDDTIVVEGNHYFPRDSVDASLLRDSATTTICPWKGTAHYHALVVDGAENRDAAWYYPDPKPAAAEIRGRIAFWKGVRSDERATARFDRSARPLMSRRKSRCQRCSNIGGNAARLAGRGRGWHPDRGGLGTP